MLLKLGILISALSLTQGLNYPQTRRDETYSHTYNGIKVVEPYKWMSEEENAAEVQEFINQQNELTTTFLKDCKGKDKYNRDLEKLKNMSEYSQPWKFGNRYFYKKSEPGSDDTSAYWYVQETHVSEPRKLSIGEGHISPDGRLLAYFNDDNNQLEVWNITRTGEVLLEAIILEQETLSFSEYDWSGDSTGFFYVVKQKNVTDSEDEINLEYLYFHSIGSANETIVVKPSENFCLPGVACTIQNQTASDDGKYLYVVSYSKNGSDYLFFYNIIHLNNQALEKSKVIPLKHNVVQKDATLQMIIFAQTGFKFYFINKFTHPHTIDELEIIPNGKGFKLQWRIVMTVGENDVMYDVSIVDKDKMIVGTKVENNKYNLTTELRYLTNGTLIRSFPSSYFQNWWFSSSEDDPEVLFVSSTLGTLTEILSFNVSDPHAEMIPLKSHNFTLEIKSLEYPTSNKNRTSLQISILRNKSKKKGPSPTFILLDGNDQFSNQNLAFIENFNGIIAIHEKLDHPFQGDKPFFSDFVEADEDIQNIIDIAEFLMKEGYSTPNKTVLVGIGSTAAWAANAVNRRPDLFGAVLLSRPKSNFNPLTGDIKLCSDGNYGDLCSNVNKVLFPVVQRVSPIQQLGKNINVEYPAVMLNIYNSSVADEEDFKWDLIGLQYLADLQTKLGNVSEKTKPFVLLPTFEEEKSEYVDHKTVQGFSDFFCYLKGTTEIKPSALIEFRDGKVFINGRIQKQ